MKKGKVWLVGAGPGDIGLFTLRGMEVLQQAEVVVYDSLVGQGVLAKVPTTARLIDVGNVLISIRCHRNRLIRYCLKKRRKVSAWFA